MDNDEKRGKLSLISKTRTYAPDSDQDMNSDYEEYQKTVAEEKVEFSKTAQQILQDNV